MRTLTVPQHYKEWRYTPQTNGISILQMPSGPAPSIQVFNNSNNQIVVAGDQRTRVADVEQNYLLAAPAYSDVVADFPYSAFSILLQGNGTAPGPMDGVIVRLYDEKQSPRMQSIPQASGGINGVNIAQLGGVNISGNLNTNVLNQPNVNAIPSSGASSAAAFAGSAVLTAFVTSGSSFALPASGQIYGASFVGTFQIGGTITGVFPAYVSLGCAWGLKGATTGKIVYLAAAQGSSYLVSSLPTQGANYPSWVLASTVIFPFPLSTASLFPSDSAVFIGGGYNMQGLSGTSNGNLYGGSLLT